MRIVTQRYVLWIDATSLITIITTITTITQVIAHSDTDILSVERRYITDYYCVLKKEKTKRKKIFTII